MELLVVANPVSGGGRARRAAEALVERLRARRHGVELMLTRRAGEAGDRLAAGPYPQRVVAVGGDGTINECVDGLMRAGTPAARAVTLAVLPTGTANVLARELSLPWDVARAARVVERGALRSLDVGRARAADGRLRHFVCMASAGLDGLVTRLVAERRSGTQGFFAYGAPLLAALRAYRPPRLRATCADGTTVDGGWILASLVRNYAGLFTVADRARPGAGAFELCVLEAATAVDIGRTALAGLRGGTSGMAGMRVRRTSALRIEALDGTDVDVQVDGDWIGTTPVELELDPAAIRIATPG